VTAPCVRIVTLNVDVFVNTNIRLSDISDIEDIEDIGDMGEDDVSSINSNGCQAR